MEMKSTVWWICFFSTLMAECSSDDEVLRSQSAEASPRRHQSLSLSPVNEAVLAGSDAILSCEATHPPPVSRIVWSEYISQPQDTIISDNTNVVHPQAERYAIISNSPNQFDLRITNTTMMDGGMYSCSDISDGPPNRWRAEAELVLLDDNPDCTSTIPLDGIVLEGECYTINCTIGYNGTIAPSMTWTGPQPYTTDGGKDSDNVWSSVSFCVDPVQDGEVFSCLTNFTTFGDFVPREYGATNLPTYSYLYQSSPPLAVYCKC